MNFWGANLDLSYSPDNYSRSATRGGPIMLDPGSWRTSLRMNSDRRKAVNVNGNVSYRNGSRDSGSEFSVGAGVEVRPSPRLEIAVRPSWSLQREGAQYVTSTDLLAYEPTYGRRYLFADLERKTLSMETRADLSLTPTLTFQLFAQPQISSGDYITYRQLQETGSFEFRDFQEGAWLGGLGPVRCAGGDLCRTSEDALHVDFDEDGTADFEFSDRDFNFRSLIGNAVLRWEYRPGSTLFLVWQRRQAEYAGMGDFDFGRDVDALWGIPADNVFIVKLNYWLGL